MPKGGFILPLIKRKNTKLQKRYEIFVFERNLSVEVLSKESDQRQERINSFYVKRKLYWCHIFNFHNLIQRLSMYTRLSNSRNKYLGTYQFCGKVAFLSTIK